MTAADDPATSPAGRALVQAIADKDDEALRALLDPDIDFRGMTPGRIWEAASVADVLDAIHQWFDENDLIEATEQVETDAFADRQRVGYRLRVRNSDGLHVVDQQAYLSVDAGRITWLRVMCAGFRPVEG
jgi:hypothetical protein